MYAFRQVSDRCLEHHACAIYVKHLLCASAYTFAYTLATGCAYALMYVQFVHLALGNEGGRVQLGCEGTCCLAWGIVLDKRRGRDVVCVFSLFLTRVGVYMGVNVSIRTHTNTHTAHTGYSVVSPGAGMRNLEGPKNPDGLGLGIHVFVYLYKVHMCINMLGGRMRSWTKCFIL